MDKLEDALAAIEKIKAEHEAEKASILKKNKELIDREKSAKAAAESAEAAREEAASEAAAKAGDIEAIKAQLEKKHQAEVKRLSDQVADRDSRLSTLTIDNAINEAITKNNVVSHHAPMLTAFLKAGVKMEDGEPTVNGVALSEHLSSFFKSDDAKHYISAPANSGASAQGSTVLSDNGGFTKETLTLTAFSKLANENKDRANAIAKAVGSELRA